MHIDFKTCLKKASDDYQKAEQAVASIKADASRYMVEKGCITVAASAMGAAAGSAVAYGVTVGMLI